MSFEPLFDSKFLKAADLPEGGIDYTISHVKKEEVGQDKDRKPVLRFHEVEKPLVLNRTNAEAIGDLYCDDYRQWGGQSIGLYVTKVQYGTKMVDGIRVRRPGGSAKKRQDHQRPLPRHADDDMPERVDADADERIPF